MAPGCDDTNADTLAHHIHRHCTVSICSVDNANRTALALLSRLVVPISFGVIPIRISFSTRPARYRPSSARGCNLSRGCFVRIGPSWPCDRLSDLPRPAFIIPDGPPDDGPATIAPRYDYTPSRRARANRGGIGRGVG
ncbi:hypothetical protein AG1IA_10248 [Rhizoctonia solani AG-1 IA]|uniref:Uncharacterized protein n=1 Tax=Thanatephorus cucumeris (strain AG1-IA) TaxID=983506 RepID=L8WG78_THACA|nr:hypothetical protein AG1IA_10248 [Rhizoctonia solani AG-1 IA]